MIKHNYDFYEDNVPEEYYESEEWIDYEQSIKKREQLEYSLPYKKMLHIDNNIRALREERNEAYVEPVAIEKFINLKMDLYANKKYLRGNLHCDIFRHVNKEHYHRNLIMDSPAPLTPLQYKIWDLLITILAYDDGDNKLRRAKFHEPGNADKHTNEFAYFDIWNNDNLIWACIVLNDSIVPLKFYNFGDVISLSSSWKHRQNIDDFYNLKLKQLP
jgi:hypothetical protein